MEDSTNRMDPNEFKGFLLSISDRFRVGDLEKMKFLLEAHLPEGTLENVQMPFELFRRMMNARLLSLNNLYLLATCLQSAGRIDLSEEVRRLESKMTFATEVTGGKRNSRL